MTKTETSIELCTVCGEPAVMDGVCNECWFNRISNDNNHYSLKEEGYSSETRTLRLIRRKKGLCTDCGKELIAIGAVRCDNCRDIRKKKRREKARTANRKGDNRRYIYRYETRKKNGLCVSCGKLAAVAGIYCEDCWFKSESRHATGTSDNWRILKELLIKQDYLCAYTGCKLVIGVNASVDHIIPRSRGGDNSIENLQWINRSVNSRKYIRTSKVFEAELLSGDTSQVRKQRKAAEKVAGLYGVENMKPRIVE